MALPVRYLVLGLILLAGAADYINRNNLSVAIVAMTENLNNTNSKVYDGCQLASNLTEIYDQSTIQLRKNSSATTFHWDQDTQGVILGGFYYSLVHWEKVLGYSTLQFSLYS